MGGATRKIGFQDRATNSREAPKPPVRPSVACARRKEARLGKGMVSTARPVQRAMGPGGATRVKRSTDEPENGEQEVVECMAKMDRVSDKFAVTLANEP
jgi:hypothetical protein